MNQNSKDDDLKRRTSMTKESILNSCKKNKLYLTPKLNDVLYLHYQGYQQIENLEEYSGLRCLWLECNAISQIAGLENQTELRCLYLHNNFIRKIENLESCTQLDTLNLSHNYIKTIERCDSTILPLLNTLDLSHNSLSSIDGLADLVKCKTLSVLDLSHNRIEDVLIVKILSQMPQLHVLTLTGNPVVSEIPSYRKTLTVECKNLTYLDSRPIFDKDRACAEAWKRGGYEEEKQEHMKWIAAQQKKITDSVRATLRLRKKLGENRSPNSMTNESAETADVNLQLNESGDESSKDILCEAVIDPVAGGINELDEIDSSIVDTAKALEMESSQAEFGIQSTRQRDDLSMLSYQNEVICPLSDISGHCLNTDTLLIDRDQNTNENKSRSTFGGTLDLADQGIIDVNSRNIFNICSNDGITKTPKPNAKTKPIIQVLLESDCTEASETMRVGTTNDEFDVNEENIADNSDTRDSIQSIERSPLNDAQTVGIDFISKIEDGSESKSKSSSAITFYCENLDDLKEINSDSDVEIEEI